MLQVKLLNHYKDDELDEFPPRKIADYNYIQQDLTGITSDYFKWPYDSQEIQIKLKIYLMIILFLIRK